MASKLEYLEEERKKLWQRISFLEKELSSDPDKASKQHSRKASEYRNKTQKTFEHSNNILINLKTIESDVKLTEKTVSDVKIDITNHHDQLIKQGKEMSDFLTQYDLILTKYPNINVEISNLEKLMIDLRTNLEKSISTYKNILSKKEEVDSIHYEIMGYKDTNSEGEEVHIEGLKQKLEKSYSSLEIQSKDLRSDLDNLKHESEEQYNTFISSKEEQLEKLNSVFDSDYNKIVSKIEGLLPSALTAGLSSAFTKKKEEEEEIYIQSKQKFSSGIRYISISALFPIIVTLYFAITKDSSFLESIERAPKIILSFLPLFAPLVWSAISSNKKVNLSKRLIEEYSHKQVLSMTIEGLSKQIDNIEDQVISDELKIKLLRIFLDVTNENPGKLISDYKSSDNPILNFFEKKISIDDSQKDSNELPNDKEETT